MLKIYGHALYKTIVLFKSNIQKNVGLVTLTIMLASGCGTKEEVSKTRQSTPSAEFVGSSTCAECHDQETEHWNGSHHQLAMQEANADTVLGDFNDATYDHFGIKSRFFKKGNTFVVNTEGPDGQNTDYPVSYVFGVYPLQQYLVEFPKGHMQVLHLCWDSRSKEEGGQRWYHLYPNEKIDHKDVLHWTGVHFNWNYMCADCHSTHLQKNYNTETLSYNTTWSEISVGCEACHGPGSEHVTWAKSAGTNTNGLSEKAMGLLTQLKDSQPVTWTLDPKTGQPVRSHPKESDAQINACARCHSHRRLVTGTFAHGQDFLDTHKPALIEDRLYHHDGQIDEEVYVYGSYVQSKMYHHGVRCNDCHNPHSLKLHAPGNALCLRCHDATKYHTPSHHHHEMGSTGAQCVECHMPEKYYMVVDARRDHSLRIPRPDLSEKLGTPNACNMCHQDKSVSWAATAFKEWYPEEVKKPHYGEILAAANRNEAGADEQLYKLAYDREAPPIIRATVMSILQQRPSQDAMQILMDGLKDKEPIIREAAIAGFGRVQPQQRLEFLAPMLSDPIRSIRTEAVRVLASVPAGLFEPDQRKAFLAAEKDFITQQEAVFDRAGGHMGLGIYYADQGDLAKSEASYRKAFSVEPQHIESRLNLAEMMYQQGRQSDALTLIGAAVRVQPNNALTHEAMGRYYVRQQQYDKGLKSIGTAVALAPGRPDLQYFYGVGLNQIGKFQQGLPHLKKAHELAPQHVEYLVGLTTICRDNRQWVEAKTYARKLVDLQPDNPNFKQLLGEVSRQN